MMLVDVFIKKLQNKRFSGKVNQRSGLFPVDNGALDYFRGLFVFIGKFFCSALCFWGFRRFCWIEWVASTEVPVAVRRGQLFAGRLSCLLLERKLFRTSFFENPSLCNTNRSGWHKCAGTQAQAGHFFGYHVSRLLFKFASGKSLGNYNDGGKRSMRSWEWTVRAMCKTRTMMILLFHCREGDGWPYFWFVLKDAPIIHRSHSPGLYSSSFSPWHRKKIPYIGSEFMAYRLWMYRGLGLLYQRSKSAAFLFSFKYCPASV